MPAPTKLIIDTDPGVDDVLAIVFALASKEVKLEALTLVFGNTDLHYTVSNIKRLAGVLQTHFENGSPRIKELFNHSLSQDAPTIPVYQGADQPVSGSHFTASYFHGKDGLSSVSELPGNPFPEVDAHPFHMIPREETDASQAILDILEREPVGTVHIAAVGPLTNLAKAWQKDPKTFAKVGRISVMGGSLEEPGNTTPMSEFNFFADPYAAEILLQISAHHSALRGRPLPLHILPLDITHQHTVPYGSLVKEGSDLASASPLAKFVSAFLRHPRKVTNSFAAPGTYQPQLHDNFVAHDPLAVAHAIFASEAWVSTPREFKLETEGKYTRGMCVVDRRNHGPKHKGANRAADKHNKTDEQHGTANGAYEGTHPFPISVVTESPGQAWFTKVFLERLAL